MMMTSFDEVISARRSVRGFLGNEVPAEQLRDIFRLAQHAPSNCNVQPWIVHCISGDSCRQLRGKLLTAGRFPEQANPDWPPIAKYLGVHRERQIDAAVQLYGAMDIERSDQAARFAAYLRNFAFFGAPHVAFIFLPKPFDAFQAMDCGIYAQTLMLVMMSRGIGSCAQGALALFPDIVREHLQVPADHRLLLGISFGYEDSGLKANAARVGRAQIEQAVSFH